VARDGAGEEEVSSGGAANGDAAESALVAFGKWSSPAEKVDPEVTRVSSPVVIGAVTAWGASDVAGGTGVGDGL